ncbi:MULTISPECIES: transcription antitermination factor NusB [Arthrospira]|jgi:N utilization substance protein B|uniref:Transcription antitermination protein NusB n=1 Tax=Limnospira platensis NIES-46 TaxID=1236695 RepID=A0A5M3T6V3_LIMPL|nr:transcription antitermination factor NusB [Arthrospira platensis]KDR58702.1 transcription antiterminator NusB [Arthrospira platensis str. Paraca]MBD2710682.1 transcription antitermination protein NusB [Arthrospira platensis FACHB-835]MDF2211007.1 transcription antitermination factor NusB [Arthrospira platensis NCB002]MDT9183966.1 transcription antitermination factor NusB [Limnospira sp. PMC 289.06]MDT9296568.1 transcription antitermination factor NusB [Arthrospira platensis PCC 7345]MDT931
MQARRTARELALLGMSQLPSNPRKLEIQEMEDVILAAVRTLTTEGQESLETAMAELQRGNDRLLSSQTRAADLQSARTMVGEAIALAQSAINRLSTAVELPELVQLASQQEVHSYAVKILVELNTHREALDSCLEAAMVDWQLGRLPHIDRDILRIAVTELLYMGVQEQIAVNEAVELAKRYSDHNSYRFINGVLRRVVDQMKTQSSSLL